VTGRVLVVDDEREIRELCRVALELEGCEVFEAADGAAAIDAVPRVRPDVIFLDLMMPGVDGWEVLERLQADERTASIPVVLLTAKAGDQDQLRGWEAGILEFVVKPFNPLVLSELVSRALEPVDPEVEAERRARIVEQLRQVRDTRRTR
jgi:CheY-like chemotaxis protein